MTSEMEKKADFTLPENSMARKVREMIHSVRCLLDHKWSILFSLRSTSTSKTWTWRGSTKMIRGLEHLFCVESMRELKLFILQKRLFIDHLYIKMPCKKAVEGLFTKACSNSTKGNTFKITESRFILDIRNKLFIIKFEIETSCLDMIWM